jgi:ketosteroid isomerase-like protein
MRSFLIFVGISGLALACTKSDADKNVETATAMFDAFNQHDWQKMTSYYSNEASFLDPSYGPNYVTKTREETAQKYAELKMLFPDIHDHIIGMYPSGDKVTVEFISTGTLSDTIKLNLPIISVLTFKDGLIIKDATYYDQENP